MHRTLFFACSSRRCLSLSHAPSPAPAPAFAEPGISPDGNEIAFVSGGDIWTVPAAGGEARLLVSHAANETRPIYSPDRRQLAFVSTRTGGGDIYVLTLATGDVRRDHVRRRARTSSMAGRATAGGSTSSRAVTTCRAA